MAEVLPVILLGNNLGERHHYLNTLVNDTHKKKLTLQLILELPEISPIDRVFKIELASKYRNVEFIIRNLKEKDMLYVSKALKCLWLLKHEYSYIINPVYLESKLYPYMITTAVNKMKNFIELQLKDPKRCQEFYDFYKNNFDAAVKFLWHCPKEFIAEEVSRLIAKLTPKHLRILCETCPQVAKVYFEGLQNNKVALRNYLNDRNKYWNSIYNVLKMDGILFLDLIEKYFDKRAFNPLSSSATRYIMKNYKDRYLAKPELYAAWLLDVKTLAKYLTHEEIKDIVMRLARAQYLNSTYTYKDAESFLKRLNASERALIKRQIFVDKDIGNKIETWPYSPPEALELETESESLGDIEHDPYEYVGINEKVFYESGFRCAKRRYCSLRKGGGEALMMSDCMPCKSSLDKLFERYRFANFDKTFFEFQKMLLTESTIEGRRNMMLVLVSKTGGNEAKLEQLLKFLVARHSNEPANLRDAIARSMVKRAFVWRLNTETWELLLKWATTSVREILHTKILRHLLSGSTCPAEDLAAYILDFCDMTTYSLNASEKACVVENLPTLLISANAPDRLLDTIKVYKLCISSVPGAEEFLVSAARNDEKLLLRLFESRVARKHLLKESFKIIQKDAAFVNALKHDVSVLANGESFVAMVSKEKPNHDMFLRSLVLYFSEPGGLAVHHRIALQKAIDEECREFYARPLAFLFNVGNLSFNDYVSSIKVKSLQGPQRKFAAALRANTFVVRPFVDVDVADWCAIGPKYVCNKVLLCSDRDIDKNIQKCLKWKKTMRVAVRLGIRSGSASDVFATVVKARPIVALKLVLSDVRKGNVDPKLWNQVKPILANLDLSKKSLQYVKRSFGNLELTSNIEADYWSAVYGAFRRASELEAMPMLCKIENLLTEVDDEVLKHIISEFLSNELTKDKVAARTTIVLSLYFRIIAKYLLISESEAEQNLKMGNVCDPFFDKIDILCREMNDKAKITDCFDDFLISLKYTKAFMSTKYVSCIPMFSKILERLTNIYPRGQYFEKYVCIHVTMLYCRSIRNALKQEPERFGDPSSVQEEDIHLIGFILGKYIGMEIQDLVGSFFQSILEIYQRGLVKFFRDYVRYGTSRGILVTSAIRGLIEGGVEAQLLAQHVFAKEHSGYIKDEEKDELLKLLKGVNNAELQFFLYAHINSY